MSASFSTMKNILCLLLCFTAFKAHSADNLLLVTIDGLRWQEVFAGYDENLLIEIQSANEKDLIKQRFDGNNPIEKRQQLLPFLWSVVANEGSLIGNRLNNSTMNVANNMWFSYPGYNELLTGKADNTIDSNSALANPNISFLEWLNSSANYASQVAAFGSWDRFPDILNVTRSKLLVNAGYMQANWSNRSNKALWLSELQSQVPQRWHNVRFDAFTAGLAKQYIISNKPKVIYLALGETDDFAHDGEYGQYLHAARRSDELIEKLWMLLQSLPQYKGNTNLLITTDHGRGTNVETWQHHGSKVAVQSYMRNLVEFEQGIVGSDHVWLAALGPDVAGHGEMRNTSKFWLNQVAATSIEMLGKSPKSYAKNIGKSIKEIMK